MLYLYKHDKNKNLGILEEDIIYLETKKKWILHDSKFPLLCYLNHELNQTHINFSYSQ